jgi:hypothetical protein
MQLFPYPLKFHLDWKGAEFTIIDVVVWTAEDCLLSKIANIKYTKLYFCLKFCMSVGVGLLH